MINLELYRIFVIVAKEGNLTRASEKLHISQPALTKHIKNLEEILGVKLFERTNKGLLITDIGNKLYERLEKPIAEMICIDKEFSKIKNINVGSHNHLLNKIFGKAVNEFYLQYPDVNLNLVNCETDEMLNKLKKKELDIVFSKKVEENWNGIDYIKLGVLNDIFIVNKSSELLKQTVSKNNLESQTIYVPRTYAQTFQRFVKLMDNKKLNLKNSSYYTILELASSSCAIGLLTKEYLDEGILQKYNLTELNTELNLEPVEFGIYLNENRFKELNDFIKIIKRNFEK